MAGGNLLLLPPSAHDGLKTCSTVTIYPVFMPNMMRNGATRLMSSS